MSLNSKPDSDQIKSLSDARTVPKKIAVSIPRSPRSTWFSTLASLGGSIAVHSVSMSTPPPTQFNPLAGLAAVIFPGAGHLVLGRPRRAFFAAVGVMGLFLFGLFLGGIDAIDSKQDKVWFYGQTLVGAPTFVIDAIHQTQFKAYDTTTNTPRTGFPGEHRVSDGSRHVWEQLTEEQIQQGMGPPNIPGLGRLNEIAMLSIVLAGMLNLIIFLDALMPSPERSGKGKMKPVSEEESETGAES
jgi:hypothetical protein